MEANLTNRQQFRMCFLENLAMPLIFLPYILTKFCGKLHFLGLFVGIVGVYIFGKYMYIMKSQIDVIYDAGMINRAIYILRLGTKYAVFLGIIASFVESFMGIYGEVVVIILAFLCFYGGSGDTTIRGRVAEGLYYVVVYPLLAVGAFAISDIKWDRLLEYRFDFILGYENTSLKSFMIGIVLIIAIFSGQENILFNLKKENKSIFFKIILWEMVMAVLMYLFLIFCTGVSFVQSDYVNTIKGYGLIDGLSYMVVRLDYIVLLIVIVAVIFTASGYMYYCCQFMKEYKEKEKVLYVIFTAMAELFVLMKYNKSLRFFCVFIIAELVLSIIQPFTIYLRKKRACNEE